MHIECLEFFQKIARVKSISKVADSSHISQSALSQQMQKLENSLGQQLLIRSNRGVKLTPAGEIVLKYADNMIRTYQKMLDELHNKEDAEIKIEADFSIATYCLPCALLRMKDMYPAHDYNLTSGTSEQIVDDVVNDICEVGFVNKPVAEDNIICQNVVEEKVVLMSLPNYDIEEKFAMEEILKHPLIILKDECIIKDKLEQALQDLGYGINDLDILARMESTEAIKTLVLKGFGVAFVPFNSIKKELYNKEIKISRVNDYSLDYNIYLINKSKEKLKDPAREFIKGFHKLGNSICC